MPRGVGGPGLQLSNALCTLFSCIFLSVRDNQTRFGAFVKKRLLLKCLYLNEGFEMCTRPNLPQGGDGFKFCFVFC